MTVSTELLNMKHSIDSLLEAVLKVYDDFDILVDNVTKDKNQTNADLGDIQLMAASMRFDLEATKRERDALRKRLGDES